MSRTHTHIYVLSPLSAVNSHIKMNDNQNLLKLYFVLLQIWPQLLEIFNYSYRQTEAKKHKTGQMCPFLGVLRTPNLH